MRAYDDGRPSSGQLRFAGFDGPLEITGAASPRRALTALYAYLAAFVGADRLPCPTDTLDRPLGADGDWTNPAAMTRPSRWGARPRLSTYGCSPTNWWRCSTRRHPT